MSSQSPAQAYLDRQKEKGVDCVGQRAVMTTLISSRYARWAAAILILGTIFRLCYSTHLELVGDEAYYWLWSRHPDFCYLDKGPVIAWFISAGTALFGQTVFGSAFLLLYWRLAPGSEFFSWPAGYFLISVAFWSVLLRP